MEEKACSAIERATTWKGIARAARMLGVSATQLRRHITGVQPSKRLAMRMRDLGIKVIK